MMAIACAQVAPPIPDARPTQPSIGACSERDPDAAAVLPDDQAGFLDAAVVECEALRYGVAAVHLDAGAAGAEIDNAADGRLAFQIDKEGSGLGDQSGGPNTMEPSMLQRCAPSQKAFPTAILPVVFVRTQCRAAPNRRFMDTR